MNWLSSSVNLTNNSTMVAPIFSFLDLGGIYKFIYKLHIVWRSWCYTRFLEVILKTIRIDINWGKYTGWLNSICSLKGVILAAICNNFSPVNLGLKMNVHWVTKVLSLFWKFTFAQTKHKTVRKHSQAWRLNLELFRWIIR